MRDFVGFADSILQALRSVESNRDLNTLMEAVTREFGCRYFALIHHDDLRQLRPDRVHIKDYPQTIAERLIEQRRYRLDPIIRACNFAGGAFLWSDLRQFITLEKRDLAALEFGAREGLNEGITVPYFRLGDCLGSCTFAGMRRPQDAARYLGPAQMIGIFAFQAARRLLPERSEPASSPRTLHPRPRDCILLAGRGYSNKEIARALGLTPRTVDGYLTEARRLFDAHDRTELVVSAVLAGAVGMHELMRRQPR